MNISTSTYLPCTWQNILKKSEEIYGDKYYVQIDIIQEVMGYEITTDGTKYLNTLRGEQNPSCQFLVGDTDDIIRLVDFASKKYNRCSCFDLLMIKSEDDVRPIRTFSECLKIVNERYGLGLGRSQQTVIDHKDRTYQKTKIHYGASAPEIRIRSLDGFSDKAMDYWHTFGINPAEFNANTENEKIYEVVTYYYTDRSGAWIQVTPSNLCFAFYFEDTNKFKIYTPFPQGREKKFFTNCSVDDVFGQHDYDPESPVIVTKSWKDRVALKQLGFNSIAFQNEGCQPNIEVNGYLLFDNDHPGREAAEILAKEYGLTQIELDPRFGCKDTAEFIEKYGTEKTKKIIENLL